MRGRFPFKIWGQQHLCQFVFQTASIFYLSCCFLGARGPCGEPSHPPIFPQAPFPQAPSTILLPDTITALWDGEQHIHPT